jgi:chromosome segregation ATPase
MGFLGKILGGKKEEVRIEQLQFAQLPGWLEKQRESLEGGISGESKGVVEKLPEIINSIKGRLENLEKAEMHKSVEQRIQSIVSSSRDNYVSGLRKALSGLEGDDPLKLSAKISESLEKMKKLDHRYGERVSFGFREQLSPVKKELNRLVDLSTQMERSIGGKREKIKILKAAQGDAEGIEGILKQIGDLEEREIEVREEIKEAEKAVEQGGMGISQIRGSEESKKYEELRSRLEALESRRAEIKSTVLNMLGPLKRVMKKYKRAADSGRAASMGNISRYLNEPVETFLNGDNTLPDVLVGMQKSIQSGALEMDKTESENVLKKIRAISFSYLEKLRSENNVLGSNVRSVGLSMAQYDVNQEIEGLEREIEAKTRGVEKERKSLEKVEREIAEKRGEISRIESELGEKLSQYTGGRVEIIY